MTTSTYNRRKAQGRCPLCAALVQEGYVHCAACLAALAARRPHSMTVWESEVARRHSLLPPEPVYGPDNPHPATRWWWCTRCHRPLTDDAHVCG